MAMLPLIALYNYDNTLFDELAVPDKTDLDASLPYIDNVQSLSKADLIAELLGELGELTPVYNKPDLLRSMIGTWSRIWKPVWVKLWQTEILKYNPIWNKDGSYTEERTGSNSGSGSTNYGRTDTHSVTGFDTNSYSPDTQEQAGGIDRSQSAGSYKETLKRTEQGNIGVTTTQAMLKEEREAAVFSVYQYIIEAFKKRFCIMIY